MMTTSSQALGVERARSLIPVATVAVADQNLMALHLNIATLRRISTVTGAPIVRHHVSRRSLKHRPFEGAGRASRLRHTTEKRDQRILRRNGPLGANSNRARALTVSQEVVLDQLEDEVIWDLLRRQLLMKARGGEHDPLEALLVSFGTQFLFETPS